MKRQEQLYEGKAKIIYATEDPDLVIQYFKDDASAFNGVKKGTIVDKGVINNHVSTTIFKYLEEKGVRTHLVQELNDREMLVKRLEIIPVEVVLRNVVAGSLAKRMGLPEGEKLKAPILEFYYKDDDLGDPMINELLFEFFKQRNIRLVDFKVEFGRHQGEVLLGDEISPDGCRFWHWETGEKMDKDRFRFNLGQVEEKYQEVYHLICGPA